MLRRLGTLASAAALTATLASVSPASAQPLPQLTVVTVADRHAEYVAAMDRVALLTAQQQRLAQTAAAAEASAEVLRVAAAADHGGLVESISGFLTGTPSELDRAAEAAEDAAHARELFEMVNLALVEQVATAEEARRAWERSERRRVRAEAELTAKEYAERAIDFARLPADYAVTDPAQDRRNRTALRAWHDYLRRLADAAVVPPPLADLADPDRLPRGLEPARDDRFDLSPGIAVADLPGRGEVTVLPAETVRAVSETFRRLGVPTEADATAYTCGGLVDDAWTGPDVATPVDAVGQWESLARVPAASAQAGDVVLLGSRRSGLTGTGVHLGGDQAVVVDAATGAAAVRTLDGPLLGARRVGLEPRRVGTAPSGGACGVPVVEPTSGSPFLVPVPLGSYRLTSGFGDSGSLWSSGSHTGLDFAAATGTPVVAAAAGTVTVEHPAWAGSLVRIDHGGGLETWYAHLSRTDVATGQVVETGEPIGLVGDAGNTTGPHLHFEVRLDDTPYDPRPLVGLG